jgi:hypothetical protein
MRYFWISESTDIKIVGVYPQRGEMSVGLHVEDPSHLFNQAQFVKLKDDIYIPKFKLRHKAKLTDIISFSLGSDFIISEKFKSVCVSEEIQDVQFVPIDLYQRKRVVQYYLLRFVRYDFSRLDFSRTFISVMETTWDEKERVRVSEAQELESLIRNTRLPLSITIKEPFFRQDLEDKMFALPKIHRCSGVFVSEVFRRSLEQQGITGLQFFDPGENS